MNMKIVLGFAILGFLIGTLNGIAAIECYTCTNATHVSACKSKSTCNVGEICFADHVITQKGTLYSFGCRADRECKSIIARNTSSSVGSGSLIGRSAVPGSCSECCKEQHCNRNLCQHTIPEKTCADSTEIHCATAGAIVDICSDTDNANKLCRRFCGLCNYTNGQWSSWFSWSNCHVTCGTGTQTRARNCSEPQPSGGGHVCVGHSQETGKCTKEPCPIHGSWADWTPWGSCSASCGIGLQRRDRSCSNPYPSRFGNHCFGDARDDEICLSSACEDGKWADWSTWSTCSRTCGDGIHTRSRTCDNPLPSIQGKYCQGDPYQVETCSLRECPEINGGWSTWSSWTQCSVTCNNGIMSRFRNCDDPAPSSGGKYCLGSPYDVQQCIIRSCPRKLSAFSASSPSDAQCHNKWITFHRFYLEYCILSFDNVSLNEGNRYRNGTFTCSYPGLYSFEAYLLAKDNGSNFFQCRISKNNSPVVEFNQHNPLQTQNGAMSATASAILHLVNNDTVSVRCSHHSDLLHSFSTFSGFLVIPDT